MATVNDAREYQIAREASDWLARLQDPTAAMQEAFADWISCSESHVRHFLQATAVLEEMSRTVGYGVLGGIAVAANAVRSDPEFVAELPRRTSALLASLPPALQAMSEAIGRLPQSARRAVTLRKVYDCSAEEIAQYLECSADHVDRYLARAVLVLVRELPESGETARGDSVGRRSR